MLGFLSDLDGVILNSEPTHVAIEQAICADFGLTVPPEEWHRYVGMPMRDIFADILKRHGGGLTADGCPAVEALVAEKRRRYIELAPDQVKFMAGAEAFLKGMRAGFKYTGLVTSSGRDMVSRMSEVFGFGRFFDTTITLDDVGRPKPDPAPYRLAAANLGLRTAQCYALEDSVHGVASANAAGCWTLALCTTVKNHRDLTNAGARHLFDSIEELRRFLGV